MGVGLFNGIIDERRELIVVTGGITLAAGNHLDRPDTGQSSIRIILKTTDGIGPRLV